MRWRQGPRSDNIEDRRGQSGGGGGFGFPRGGGRRIRIPTGGRKGGMGIGGIVVVLVLMWFFGGDLGQILGPSGGGLTQAPTQSQTQQPNIAPGKADEMKQFVSAILGSTEEVWNAKFKELNRQYKEPKLVLFTDYVNSACGNAQAAMGPFYCPADQKVYIDLSFYNDMKNKLGAPGDFAQAYVIAHEVGHHIQTILGIAARVTAARQSAGEVEGNLLQVRMELQADCLAGVWANSSQRARNWLEKGDIEEGLNAASAIGDDRLQRRSQGRVVPESFTHGSSAQRVRWFKRGLESGKMGSCDTFRAREL
ncbi:MAG: neutral zinc metallopeptidase [Rhizobiales bacterium]|nr:neutral zinc metallopeptidase [Hyphomicrobiales bacterium]